MKTSQKFNLLLFINEKCILLFNQCSAELFKKWISLFYNLTYNSLTYKNVKLKRDADMQNYYGSLITLRDILKIRIWSYIWKISLSGILKAKPICKEKKYSRHSKKFLKFLNLTNYNNSSINLEILDPSYFLLYLITNSSL